MQTCLQLVDPWPAEDTLTMNPANAPAPARAEPDVALEKLQLIHHLLDENRHESYRYWCFFALWGSLGLAFFLLDIILYLSHATLSTHIVAFWSYWIGVALFSLLLGIRALRRAKIRTFAERAVASTWFAL